MNGGAPETSSFHPDTPDGAADHKAGLATPQRAAAQQSVPTGLHIVATPIGNAADITLRALDVLARVDLIACEDTRVTGKLLARHGIGTPTTPYHDHNAAKVRPGLLAKLAGGARIALVSDAGTPLINDPGYRLVREAVAAGIGVTTLPGPSSILAALCVAGLPTDRFFFAGFLPPKSGQRQNELRGLARIPATLLFLESAQRLPDALADLAAVLGPGREAAVTRELTKLHEEIRRGPLADLAAHYAKAGPPKGEVVLVVGPPLEAVASDGDVDAALVTALKSMTVREAADAVAAATAAPRRLVYARALALKGALKGDGQG